MENEDCKFEECTKCIHRAEPELCEECDCGEFFEPLPAWQELSFQFAAVDFSILFNRSKP